MDPMIRYVRPRNFNLRSQLFRLTGLTLSMSLAMFQDVEPSQGIRRYVFSRVRF
jgi:hypothetical protein